MTQDEILELSFRAMRDEGATAEECIERFGGQEIAEQIRALESPLEYRRSVAVAVSAGERKAAMLRSLGEKREGWLGRLVRSPLRGGALALLALTALGATTAGTANVAGVRDSIGEALGLTQPEGECAAALNGDGNVLCAWGSNGSGQLAIDPSVSPNTDPEIVEALQNAVQVSAGSSHALALLADGTVVAWGENESGQLGRPRSDPLANRVEIEFADLTEGAEVRAVAAGESHSLALLDDGRVLAWGANDEGQLGTSATGTANPTPRVVIGVANVTAIAAGSQFSLALVEDGSVWMWGDNSWGLQGNGEIGGSRPFPEQVPGLDQVTAIAAGARHALALNADGSLWAWGARGNGQLGDDGPLVEHDPGGEIAPEEARSLIYQVDIEGEVVAIAAGQEHSMALMAGGTVQTFGWDEQGQLGNDDEFESQSRPVEVEGLLDVVGIEAGARHSLALLRDGSVRAWGQNDSGELGNGSDGPGPGQPTPVRVEGLRNVAAISAGASFSLALREPTEGDFVAITKGDWVELNADDGCADPSELPPSTLREENERLQCPPNGTVLQVVGGPVEFEGQRFWALSGFGWFNETYLAFHHEGSTPYPEREELADQGLIAYVGPDQGLWLMSADGSDQHRINRGPVLTQPQWSPDGRLIAFGGEDRVRIVDLWGAMLVDLPGYLLSGSPWPDSNNLVNVLTLDGQPGQVGIDGAIYQSSQPGSSFNLLESPTGDDWQVSQTTTIVYPEFSPAGVSDWIVLTDREGERITVLANGSLPAWQPEALNEEPAERAVDAARGILQYYPDGPFRGDCGAATAAVCVREIGRNGNEIVFEVARLQLEQPLQVVLLFVRPEGDGYVVGHLEPAFCQGDPNCPPPAGATVEIVVKETCVNARHEPGRLGPINRCLRAGEQAILTGESQEVDARLWVELEGLGWVSASYIRCVAGCVQGFGRPPPLLLEQGEVRVGGSLGDSQWQGAVGDVFALATTTRAPVGLEASSVVFSSPDYGFSDGILTVFRVVGGPPYEEAGLLQWESIFQADAEGRPPDQLEEFRTTMVGPDGRVDLSGLEAGEYVLLFVARWPEAGGYFGWYVRIQ